MKFGRLFIAVIAAMLLMIGGTAMAGESEFFIENGILKAYYGSDDYVKVPDGVTEIAEEVFMNNLKLETIYIPSGVTRIGKCAFSHCENLTSVSMPSTVTTIDDYAFEYCYDLESLTMPSELTTIGLYAFRDCGLESVTIPSKVTDFECAFTGCMYLTEVTVKYGVTEVSDAAFYDCKLLNSVSLPAGLEKIGQYAFQNCYSLPGISLPSSLTSIGYYAFYDSGLMGVTIPAGVTEFQGAFAYCDDLSSVTFAEGLTEIDMNAFMYCRNLTSVEIPDGVEVIGLEAFKNSGLQSVTIPDSVISMNKAFYNCTSLSSVTMGSDITHISNEAFYGCTSLKSITLPDSLESIGTNAFSASGLTGVTIPAGVTSISKAFVGCESLTAVSFAAGTKNICIGALEYCTGVTSVTLPDSLESIGERAFKNCTGLKNIALPSGITGIEKEAFSASSLTSITIPDALTYIGESAFGYCGDLTSVKVESTDNVTVDYHAFTGCSGLKYVFFPNGCTLDPNGAFDAGTVVFRPNGANVGLLEFEFKGSTPVTADNCLEPRIFSAAPDKATYKVGDTVTIRVATHADVDSLDYTLPEGARLVSDPHQTYGILREWKIILNFEKEGVYEFEFANADDPSQPTASTSVNIIESYQVLTAKFFEEQYEVGEYAAAYVTTDIEAAVLSLYTTDGRRVASWNADGYSAVSGSTRMWNVYYKFTGAGNRTVIFKASKDGTNYCPGVSASVTILAKKSIDVSSASFKDGYAAKGTAATATVETGKDAKYLVMYNGSTKIRTWKAADYSVLEGDTRVWTVKHSFTGVGSRTMTFKASYDNKKFGAAQDADIIVTTGSEYNVNSAAFNADHYAKGKTTTATVKTGLDAKYLTMYNGSTKVKTWAASSYSKISGSERVWTVTYAFSGTGSRTLTFKASKDKVTYGTGKSATVLITSGNSINVTSAKFGVDYAPKGTAVAITVKTGADAKYLVMYNGSSKIKAWNAADNSKISGTNRVWTVKYTFTGTGTKNMTFKASKDNKNFGTGKNATILVTSGNSINVTSAAFSQTSVAKGTAVTITVKTGADAKYLAMYTEKGAKAKTWKAADCSKISGTVRVWTVTYTFSGVGNRSMTFKASKDNSTFGTGKSANITITAN